MSCISTRHFTSSPFADGATASTVLQQQDVTSIKTYSSMNIQSGPPLTPRESTVLKFLRAYLKGHNYAPTLREIKAHIESCGQGRGRTGKSSTSSISYVITSLEGKGYLRKQPGRGRSIELIDLAMQPSPSIRGGKQERARAGELSLPICPNELTREQGLPNYSDAPAMPSWQRLRVPVSLLGAHASSPDRLCLLRVGDRSLLTESLLDVGDLLVVSLFQQGEQPPQGCAVIGITRHRGLPSSVHLGKWWVAAGAIRVQPFAPQTEALIMSDLEFDPIGRVIATIRTY